MAQDPPVYHSFMLRLWEVKADGERIWRASLEQVDSGERQGFTDLAELFGFLERLTRQDCQGESASSAQKR
jgi:hypothetical protein